MFDGILDGGERADDALVVGDALVGIQRHVEVHLGVGLGCGCWGKKLGECRLTRTRTRLPFTSTSEIESLFDRDMVLVFGCGGSKVNWVFKQGAMGKRSAELVQICFRIGPRELEATYVLERDAGTDAGFVC